MRKDLKMAKKKNKVAGIVLKVLLSVVTFLVIAVIGLYGVMWILVNGPSPKARELFVISVDETSAGGFLARMYLSEAEIQEIKKGAADEISDDTTDSSLIQIPDKNRPGESTPDNGSVTPDGSSPDSGNAPDSSTPPEEDDGIEVVDIVGATYNGKLLIIEDPTRVFVGVPDAYGEGCSGLTVKAMIGKYGAVAGTNAGGFYDPNGNGTGGIPDGIVIYEGELLWGQPGGTYSLAGIDGNGILHVGNMTGAHALEIGVQYAASYGPALVINGQPAGSRLGGGLNPRTAIGQRADGAMLLLVINGRSIDSLGATLDDLASIMLDHGAVNASNLDGGSSSIMIMEDEYLTSSAYIFGERVVATAILVRE